MNSNILACEKITIIVFEIAGKLTLTDYVLAAARTKVQEVADEAECGITIKSTGNSIWVTSLWGVLGFVWIDGIRWNVTNKNSFLPVTNIVLQV